MTSTTHYSHTISFDVTKILDEQENFLHIIYVKHAIKENDSLTPLTLKFISNLYNKTNQL